MELKIKKIFFKSYILNTENQTEFIIKKNLKTYGEYSVCNSRAVCFGVVPFVVCPRVKFVLCFVFGKDVFNAFVKRFRVDFYGINNFTAAVTDRIFNKFDILINNKLKGLITNHKISCDEIDDKALLAMLYVFSKFVSDNEKELVSAKIM